MTTTQNSNEAGVTFCDHLFIFEERSPLYNRSIYLIERQPTTLRLLNKILRTTTLMIITMAWKDGKQLRLKIKKRLKINNTTSNWITVVKNSSLHILRVLTLSEVWEDMEWKRLCYTIYTLYPNHSFTYFLHRRCFWLRGFNDWASKSSVD